MANISTGISENRKAGVKRQIRRDPRTDMTPMVDLGFLLISFFVITAQLSQPYSTSLFMPKDGPPTKTGETSALTLLLSADNTVYYYEGQWTVALAQGQIKRTGFSPKNGIGDVIAAKQLMLDTRMRSDTGRNELVLMIKAGKEASYGAVMKAVDEVLIHRVKRYVLVSPDPEETAWLSKMH